MPENKGKLVVLEGIDGAGTTTHVARLAERLRHGGVKVHPTREPSDGPVGTLIRQVLTGRLVVPGGRAPTWATMALLFAADRMDHFESEIEPFLASGSVVLSDRYDASSLAYQSVSSGADASSAVEWIRTLNRYVRRPDLTIVLDVSPEVAADRRSRRGDGAQLYDDSEVQGALARFYENLAEHMPGDRIALVDGAGSVDDVHGRVWTEYSRIFS